MIMSFVMPDVYTPVGTRVASTYNYNVRKLYTFITGASEGLGKSMAIECAERGMNLVLVDLPSSGLHHVADFLKRSFRISVIVIEKDISEESAATAIYEYLCEHDININILINNAGVGNTQFFEDVSFPVFERQIRLNILATTSLTYHLLPLLKQHDEAYILNVGSLACFFLRCRENRFTEGRSRSFISFQKVFGRNCSQRIFRCQ